MQGVYEDGPKRDQRLWMGDLYLEALANTASFQQYDVTKRCLYLLAGLANPRNESRVPLMPIISWCKPC